MAADGEGVRCFEVAIDKVVYRIAVQADNPHGYLGDWRCMACAPNTWSTLREDSMEEALHRAELLGEGPPPNARTVGRPASASVAHRRTTSVAPGGCSFLQPPATPLQVPSFPTRSFAGGASSSCR